MVLRQGHLVGLLRRMLSHRARGLVLAGGSGHPGADPLGTSWCPLQAERNGQLGVFFDLDLNNVPWMGVSPWEGSSKTVMPFGGRQGLGRQRHGPISPTSYGDKTRLLSPGQKNLYVASRHCAPFPLVIS